MEFGVRRRKGRRITSDNRVTGCHQKSNLQLSEKSLISTLTRKLELMSNQTTPLNQLFSPEVELHSFTSNINHIPEYGSIIYTVFLDRKEFIYVGIGGISGKSVKKRNPRSRIIQHAQGRRSGDQFCIYIQDFYVIPSIITKPYEPKKGYLDALTKEFIQSRLTYRYIVIQTDDSDKVVRRLERELQSNHHAHGFPKLNGVVK